MIAHQLEEATTYSLQVHSLRSSGSESRESLSQQVDITGMQDMK